MEGAALKQGRFHLRDILSTFSLDHHKVWYLDRHFLEKKPSPEKLTGSVAWQGHLRFCVKISFRKTCFHQYELVGFSALGDYLGRSVAVFLLRVSF